ncbi:MAG TPA: histidinol-phosphate transaminase [Gemmatimonadaceae bacterium]|nr:histidinol-phosphate transaminase [Gemmatimonadaceae bacterium]
MTTASRQDALELARTSYRAISLYSPDRTPCELDLSDNTNLWGAAPAAVVTIRSAASSALTRYPALYAPGLKAALAGHVGVRAENVVTGCGSDDVLDSAIRAFAEPGDRVAHPEPSFAMIPIFARMNGLDPVAIPLRADLDIDADALLATGARIIYICSPNNPTGTLASPGAIERVIDGAPGIVILDEAYAEFAGVNAAASAPARARLLVVRTMSKAFGLAGLRIGYGCGAPEIVAAVEKSRGPYKVSALAEQAGTNALRDDRKWVDAHVRQVVELRARFATELGELGLVPIRSHANFVLVPVERAQSIAASMRASGVAVRPFEGLAGIGDALRISIGPWPVMERCLSALREALA